MPTLRTTPVPPFSKKVPTLLLLPLLLLPPMAVVVVGVPTGVVGVVVVVAGACLYIRM